MMTRWTTWALVVACLNMSIAFGQETREARKEFEEVKIPGSDIDDSTAIFIAAGAAIVAIGIGYLIYRAARSKNTDQASALSQQFLMGLLPGANDYLADERPPPGTIRYGFGCPQSRVTFTWVCW
jgi:hypothetical protein